MDNEFINYVDDSACNRKAAAITTNPKAIDHTHQMESNRMTFTSSDQASKGIRFFRILVYPET